MKRIRNVLFWLHLAAGVLAGIFIFIMCVTGALLAFEKQIVALAEREQRVVAVPENGAPPLSVDELVAAVQAAVPQAKLSGISWRNDPAAAVQIALGREGLVYVDPYTGALTGEGAAGWRAFFRFNTDLHRWLALSGDHRQLGKSINGAANLLFLFLAVSGVYIWFPRRWTRRHFAPIIRFRRTNSGKARDFNWHNTIGFWSSAVLIVLTLTGVIISYQWAGNLLYTLTGNEVPAPPPQQGPGNHQEAPAALPANLGAAVAAAQSHTPWKSVSLRLPVTREQAVFTIEEGVYWNIFARSTLTVDARTGQVVKWEAYGEQNAARRLRSWARFTHTGETGGLVGQLIGFLACVGGAVLVWTGLALALRRFGNWRARRAPAAEI